MRPRGGFDRPPDEPRVRINEAIRVPQVRLIGADGEQIGVKDRDEALEYAWNLNLDLVEVAADARPPVCRVMDYSKYKYEQEQKAKLARKHQNVIVIKEIKLRPKVGQHDYETKRGHVIRFLKKRDKVKVTIMFRGREMTHPERGRDLLLRLAEDLKELAVIESEPLQDGRNMVMMLAPSKQLMKEDGKAEGGEDEDRPVKPAPTVKPTPTPVATETQAPEPAVVGVAEVVAEVEEAAPAAAEAEPVEAVAEIVVAETAAPVADPTPEPATAPAAAKPVAKPKATAKPKAPAKQKAAAAEKPAAKAPAKPKAPARPKAAAAEKPAAKAPAKPKPAAAAKAPAKPKTTTTRKTTTARKPAAAPDADNG